MQNLNESFFRPRDVGFTSSAPGLKEIMNVGLMTGETLGMAVLAIVCKPQTPAIGVPQLALQGVIFEAAKGQGDEVQLPKSTAAYTETISNTQPSAGIRGEDYKGDLSITITEAENEVGEPEVAAVALPVKTGEPIPLISVHDPQGHQNEGNVTVDPNNPAIWVVTFNSARRRITNPSYPRDLDATVARSTDRGKTWQEIIIPGFPAQTYDLNQGNSAVAFSPNSALRFATLSFDPFLRGPYGGVFYLKSDDRGLNWTSKTLLVQETGYVLDVPYLAVDPVDANRMAVSYTRMEGWQGDWKWDRWEVWYRMSVDGGNSWASPVFLPGTKRFTTTSYPYFGPDGTLYVAAFSNDYVSTTDVVFFKNGGNRRVISPNEPSWRLYQFGTMPSIIKDSSGKLRVTWGDCSNIKTATSLDDGNSWASPEILIASSGQVRFFKPATCLDPLGRGVVTAYRYDGNTRSLQPYIGLIGGDGVYPVSSPVYVPCDILSSDIVAGFNCERQLMGDRNNCSSNQDLTKPGVVAAFTEDSPVQSEPPGYVLGLDANVKVAEQPTVAWPGQTTSIDCRPNISGTQPTSGTVMVDILNAGLEPGTFQVASWSGGGAGCPNLGGIPTSPILIGGRQRVKVPITVSFPLSQDRLCQYGIGVRGGFGNPVITSTLSLRLDSKCRQFFPIIFKNSR